MRSCSTWPKAASRGSRRPERDGGPSIAFAGARAAAWGPAVAWAVLIFYLSSRPVPPDPPGVAVIPYHDKLEHFAEYGILALLTLLGLRRGPRLPRPLSRDFHAHLAFFASTVYAYTDELHQAFVPLRQADAGDFVVDALGAFCAAFAFSTFVPTAPPPLRPPEREWRSSGGLLRYTVRGEGAAVLHLHGWHGSKRYFEQAPARLPGLRHLAPDLLGFGNSASPARFSYSPRDQAEVARALARSLGINAAVVVGHSMGGAVALELALAHPKFVRALVLVEPAVRLPVPFPFILTREQAHEVGVGLAGHFFGFKAGLFKHLAVEDSRRFTRPLLEDVISVPLHASARSIAALARANLAPRLKELRCPVLLVFGDAAHAVRAKYARLLADSVPGATLVHIPHTSHCPMIEAPDEFYSSVRAFLDSAGERASGGEEAGA